MDKKRVQDIGYSTRQALNLLHDEILEVLTKYEVNFHNKNVLLKLWHTFDNPYQTPMALFSFVASILVIIILVWFYYILESILLIVILIFNCAIIIREDGLQKKEMYRKVHRLLSEIRLCEILCRDWTPENYPHLSSPISPCIALQWTYRDKKLVNLPWAMLVKGDHIVMQPGHRAPALCKAVDTDRRFVTDELYGQIQPENLPTKPTTRELLPDLVCVLDETPYLNTLILCLERSTQKPPTIYQQQRHLLITRYIQRYGFFFAIIICVISGILTYTDITFPGIKTVHWSVLFIETPVISIVPLLPLMLPFLWIIINLWGIARLDTHINSNPQSHENNMKTSFQEDLDSPIFDYDSIALPFRDVLTNFFEVWRGSANLLGRTANVVQVLGSITTLCCIDKKGILSWPNPTAEKVFLLPDAQPKESSPNSFTDNIVNPDKNMKEQFQSVILDLSHNQHNAFSLAFDDQSWNNHLNALKPLGLAILLNTCCPLTQKQYNRFCAHVTAVATNDQDLVPVTNRYDAAKINSYLHGRCLCEVARQIGFTPRVRDVYKYVGAIASYRHLQPETYDRDIYFTKQLHLTSKVKVPFPHALSVLLQEYQGGSLQMFCQGTADIILDNCDDYWDGNALLPLSSYYRRKTKEFYQRFSLTGYCTAFSYKPLTSCSSSVMNLHTKVIEFPPESEKINYTYNCIHQIIEDKTMNRALSLDYLQDITRDDSNENNVAEEFDEMQKQQIFLGMVAMQYQTHADIVQLIERLDAACIRFVHFSKENELRSRVFSEKMGRESGWNCHISLLSEDVLSSINSEDDIVKQEIPNRIFNEAKMLLPRNYNKQRGISSSLPYDLNCPQYSPRHKHRKKKSSENHVMNNDCFQQLHKYNRSLSRLSDAGSDIRFDMSNRAKLPRGIENIRPHLENVDNVPLLVSLFTDCSPSTTREMIDIMQTYGAIVVCMGSSASSTNTGVYLQADCSIGIEPLYPQICQDVPAYTESNLIYNRDELIKHHNALFNTRIDRFFESIVSPLKLSHHLNSLPCSISFARDQIFSIITLIAISRRFSNGLWSCLQFWGCCACSIATINTISSCLSLPPAITPLIQIYLMCIFVPTIAISLAHIEVDPNLMNRATFKRQNRFDTTTFIFVVWSYGIKFLPMISSVVCAYNLISPSDIKINSSIEFNNMPQVISARAVVLFCLTLHLILLSSSFVHREQSIWQRNPFTNFVWSAVIIILLFIHLIIFIIYFIIYTEINDLAYSRWPLGLGLLLSVLVTIIIMELCKWQEIKFNKRSQRRARLDFGTKLGMNSPF